MVILKTDTGFCVRGPSEGSQTYGVKGGFWPREKRNQRRHDAHAGGESPSCERSGPPAESEPEVQDFSKISFLLYNCRAPGENGQLPRMGRKGCRYSDSNPDQAEKQDRGGNLQ